MTTDMIKCNLPPKENRDLAEATCCAALVKEWRDLAGNLALEYHRCRDTRPTLALKIKARSETYAECANRLESAIAANGKISEDAGRKE